MANNSTAKNNKSNKNQGNKPISAKAAQKALNIGLDKVEAAQKALDVAIAREEATVEAARIKATQKTEAKRRKAAKVRRDAVARTLNMAGIFTLVLTAISVFVSL